MKQTTGWAVLRVGLVDSLASRAGGQVDLQAAQVDQRSWQAD